MSPAKGTRVCGLHLNVRQRVELAPVLAGDSPSSGQLMIASAYGNYRALATTGRLFWPYVRWCTDRTTRMRIIVRSLDVDWAQIRIRGDEQMVPIMIDKCAVNEVSNFGEWSNSPFGGRLIGSR